MLTTGGLGELPAFSFSFKVFMESLSFGNNESIKERRGLLCGSSEFSCVATGTATAIGAATGGVMEAEWASVSFGCCIFLPLLSN